MAFADLWATLRLSEVWGQWFSSSRESGLNNTQLNSILNAPLLNQQEIINLAQELEGIRAKLPYNPKQSEALRQGEQSSRFMGAGIEYEESRAYELGDEIRRINWRLMARTGHAYTKLYQEERQENWFILVDHRSGMRLGTRKRLKATQAVRVAGYFAWQAQQQGIPVAVGRLAESLVQSPIYEGRSAYAQVMQALSQACPPITPDFEPALNDVLLSLSPQMQAGSRLIIISDFVDINAASVEILTAMQARVLVKTVLITDASELELPALSGLELSSPNGQRFSLQTNQQCAEFKAQAEHYFAHKRALFNQANTPPYEIMAHANLQTINQLLSQQTPQAGTSQANYQEQGYA